MRYQNGETVRAVQTFQAGRTINVEVINLATDAVMPVTTGTATESAQQAGVYIWPSSDLVTPPASYTEAAVVFTDATSGLFKVSKIVFRGYVDNVDATISSVASAVAGLQDLSVADVQTALTTQGYTAVRAGLLDNLDAAVTGVPAAILAAVLGGGDTVDAALSRLETLEEMLFGGREIDFTGSDVLGWQRVEKDTGGVEVARYNLFDETGSRITGTVAAFIAGLHMISSEVKI